MARLTCFQLYIALMSIHALFLAINHFLSCLGNEWHECRSFSPPATIVFLLFLIFEGLLFALFTSIMFGTQVSAIWYDETVSMYIRKDGWTKQYWVCWQRHSYLCYNWLTLYLVSVMFYRELSR